MPAIWNCKNQFEFADQALGLTMSLILGLLFAKALYKEFYREKGTRLEYLEVYEQILFKISAA